jgi:ribosome maturation factor RimP
MIQAEFIRELLKDELINRGVFLVDATVRPGNRITVFIDSLKGVTIEECIAVSRFIEGNLNRDAEDFELEVSSPGLDNPLKLPVQFQKNVGRMLDVVKKDGLKVTGKLVSAGDDWIRLETEEFEKDPGGRKKIRILKETEYRFEEIKTAKVNIQKK